MELKGDLVGLEDEIITEEIVEKKYQEITESTLIPSVGVVLGLDISETSSGVCLYQNGEKKTWNLTLTSKDGEFLEVRLRRELKGYLEEIIKGLDFDLIIIEDAFQGVNAQVTRKLYALNTAIDELILDGVCTCKDFKRVNNQLWKSWLYKADQEGLYKLLDDKLRIEKCLEVLGVIEEHTKGYQDRLDACGMLLGYFLCRNEADTYLRRKAKKRVSMEDVRMAYDTEKEFCLYEAGYGVRDLIHQYIQDRTISKKLILDYLTDNPSMVFVTDKKIRLGMFGGRHDLPVLDEGGYFAFWVDEKKIKKYINE